ncbi:2TM domain-containing protein [Altibacter sp.]|uniref:2TM domain-containing protein n=1 Tax=Altibacter sp. TaxID=2024823 RepID=UPI0025B9A7AD|nr:2TM domain-containing protein [Altibacter sp.]
MHIPSNKYLKAKKKVQAIKRFYSHLIVYLLVNAGLLFFRIEWAPFLFSQQDAAFISWLNWNTFGITFFWGLGLLFHALSVFVVKFKFLKKWEERKIKELIKKEEETMYNRKD